jgi:hypothetical protein|tara:strand:+ start:393 stop:851 length:459 start_codon:yes stop_codon:yes gene_type:complete
MPYARGKRSKAISDRSGQAFPYTEMVKEWNGSLVHISEFEAKHPQLDPPYHKADAIALQNTRSQKFQQPQVMSALNPTFAPSDNTIASSGGATVQVANLTLPGDFAFQTFNTEVTSNGVTTELSSMQARDPALQNRRREASAILGNITVSIS